MNIFTNLKPLALLLILFSYVTHLKGQCISTQQYVEISIDPDQYADIDNTNWTVTNDAGTILASGSPTGNNFCVPKFECVYFNIYDDYGDGLGNGGYEVSYGGDVIASGSNFGTTLTIELGGCDPGISCSNPTELDSDGTYTTNRSDHWYSYTASTTGYHEITTCNVNTCNTKIYGYETCTGIITSENQEQTTFYSDDYCSTQAEVTVILQAGTEYFIRIGDNNTSCTGEAVQWSINFQGIVNGCTDINACNFNPTATVDDNSCNYPGDNECVDGPDLKILQDVLEASMVTSEINNSDNCYVAEGCINGYGQRELIRFTTHIKNIGNQDFYVGSPPADVEDGDEQWEFDLCHNHWHYEGYAEYLLFDEYGAEIPIGFKNGFCVLDLECSDGGTAKYTCSNQGVSPQCGDIYSRNLACQWIDVTDIETGKYTLVVRVNWDQSPDALGRVETDFANNWAQVCFNLTRNNAGHSIDIISDCPAPVDCFSNPFGTAVEDCLGACGGNAVTGDIDANYMLTNDDIVTYHHTILNETIPATDCNDIAADGELNILDAVLIAGCINDSNGTTDGHNHAHCDFPTVAIHNNTQSACFSLGNLNASQNYFDILIENPAAHITAYNLDLNGVTISSLENLEPGYTSDLDFDASGEIVSVSYQLDNLARYNSPTPILRVYYTEAETICLNEVIDVVNEFHELIDHCVDGTCLTVPTTNDNVCNATYAVNGSSVTISGLNNPINAVKIIYPNFTTYWECNSWEDDCNTSEIVNNIPNGTYYISLNTYDAGWNSVCSIFEALTIGGNNCVDNDNDGICQPDDCDDNNASLPATPGTTCNDGNANTNNDVYLSDGCTCQGTASTTNTCDAEYTVTENSVTFSGLNNPINSVKIIYPNFTTYWECNSWEDGCNASEIINNIPNGEYYISLNTYDAGWNSVCSIFEALTIGGNSCVDNDNDGICQPEDCNDNNANLPTTPGTACNDGNADTDNDLILEDGCTCEGTTIGAENCNANYNVNGSQITFDNLLDPVIAIKVIEQASFTTFWECNTWATPCNASTTINNIPAGEYVISLNTYDASWNSICNIYEVVTIVGNADCIDTDSDGVCDVNDCEPTNPTLPAIPGSICSDSNTNTENDVILADGCTCEGTAIASGCNATYNVNGNSVIFNNINAPVNSIKLINLDYTTYWECNTWLSGCETNELINNIPSGDYYISINTYDAGWNTICSIFELITIDNSIPIVQPLINESTEWSVDVYPNPFKDIITIKFSTDFEKEVEYEIFSTQGIRLARQKVEMKNGQQQFHINTDRLNTGYYLLKIKVDKQILSKSIVKM